MQNFEQLAVADYTKQAYHNYATYVILDRAIPRLEDGLKPVQRRILYAMSELGLKSTSKPKKSARTVGDVLGKFHPHGDSACYEAMVLMAQDFSYRYPLVQGQGNWGAIDDPKSFAAMRYTEANLSPYSQALLKLLNPHTTEWGPNFDGTLKEPLILPSQLPNILLNGASGIAVGIATDIPPHNMTEVGNACIAMLKNADLTIDELMSHLPGPDYPTGAEIINSPAELKNIALSGQGMIKQRAKFTKEQDTLLISELPYQVSSSKVIQQIADLMVAKKLPQIRNLRDESDETATVAIMLTLRSNRVSEDEILPILFAETDLEKSHKVNITYISPERKPVQTGILPLLKNWLTFNENTLIKQLNHQLETANERLHILDGLLLIFNNLDEVIRIIRYEDDPKQKLMATFSLSALQAQAILETKLKHLAKLEVLELQKEHDKLTKLVQSLKELLENPRKRKNHMIKTIENCLKEFSDDRRSQLIERKTTSRSTYVPPVPKEAVTIILSKNNWVKLAKGHDFDGTQTNFKTGDAYATSIQGQSHWPTILFDEAGVAYTLSTHELPSVRSQGEPITTMVNPSAKIRPQLINAKHEQSLLLASKLGYGFISELSPLTSRNKTGKKVLSLGDSQIANILPIYEDTTHIALITQQGRVLVISPNDIPRLNKGKGNKLIQIHKKDHANNEDAIVFIQPLTENAALVIHSGKRFFKITTKDLPQYFGPRGQRGVLLPRGYRRVTNVEIQAEKLSSNL